MKQYLDLAKHIMDNGVIKESGRNNMPNTKSIFGYQMRFDLKDGFPLLTTKKMHFKGIVTELLWFLKGDTNIKYLIDNGCNIWNEDSYSYYCKSHIGGNNSPVGNDILKKLDDYYTMYKFDEFIDVIKNTPKNKLPKFGDYTLGDCGFQYGRLWRDWYNYDALYNESQDIDQIANVINSLRTNPYSRRHIVTAIDPAHDQDLALFPCHTLFQFNARPLSSDDILYYCEEKNYLNEGEQITQEQIDSVPKYFLDCQMFQRSCDTFLGWSYNTASYALLTNLFAQMCNMIPGEFIWTGGDVHIYENHFDQINEQLTREPLPLPKIKINKKIDKNSPISILNDLTLEDFILEDYKSHPRIKGELSTGILK